VIILIKKIRICEYRIFNQLDGREVKLVSNDTGLICFFSVVMSGEAASDEKPNFGGKYVLVRNENLNEFLAANGKYSKKGVAYEIVLNQTSVTRKPS